MCIGADNFEKYLLTGMIVVASFGRTRGSHIRAYAMRLKDRANNWLDTRPELTGRGMNLLGFMGLKPKGGARETRAPSAFHEHRRV